MELDMERFEGLMRELFEERKNDVYEQKREQFFGDVETYKYESTIHPVNIGPLHHRIQSLMGSDYIDEAFDTHDGEEITLFEWEFNDEKITALECGAWFYKVGDLCGIMEFYFDYARNDHYFRMVFDKKQHEESKKLFYQITDEVNNFSIYQGQELNYQPGSLQQVTAEPFTFDELVIDPKTRQSIMDNTLYFLDNQETLAAQGVELRRGVLMSGPPGDGKTSTCKAICAAAPEGTTKIWVTANSITAPQGISHLFYLASQLSPTILIFEDIDALGVSRAATGNTTQFLGELLNQLNGLHDAKGIITLGTTNHPEMVDKALSDRPKRFDRHFKFNHPEDDLRRELFMKYLSKYDLELDESIISEVVVKSKGLPAVFFDELVQTAIVQKSKLGDDYVGEKHIKSALDEIVEFDDTKKFDTRNYV